MAVATPTPTQVQSGASTRQVGRVLVDLAVDSIDVEGNPRTSIDGLDELAASIAELGVQSPIQVRPVGDRYQLVYGQRRLLAARQLGMTTIPALIDTNEASATDVAIAALAENLQREDLNALEEARGYKAVLDGDAELTQAELGRRLGRAAPTISNALRLLELDPTVQDLVAGGGLSSSHVKPLVGLAPKTQRAVAKETMSRGLSTHGVEDHIRRLKQQEQWRKQNEQNELNSRKAAEERRERLAEHIAKLEKRKVPKDGRIIVVDQVGGTAAVVLEELKKAGYTNVKRGGWQDVHGRGEALDCDCVAWRIQIGWNGGLQVGPGCVNQKHVDAKYQASRKADADRYALHERVQEDLATVLPAQLGVNPPSRLVARIALWGALGWRHREWASEVDKRKGTKRKRIDPWATVNDLGEDELHVELGKALAKDFRSQGGFDVDWQAIADELGIPDEPTPAKKPKRAKADASA